jgi:LPPG:FO 2-phospho-L-lactate transferase
MITVIAGGVGAARFLRGLVEIIPPSEITAIINTADDFEVHGLHVSPDVDTVRATLADDAGPQGWGLANETWNVMNALRVVGSGAPEGSRATDWFSLGDRDLAIHLYRTQRLKEGATLCQVTNELRDITGVRSQLLPMSNDAVRTRLTTADDEDIDFQEYFVARQHSDAVRSVRFAGAADAKPAPGVVEAIRSASKVIIAPSNPLLSIAPILALPEIATALSQRRAATVGISPLVAGRAIKGPADHLMAELGHRADSAGVAKLWAPYCTSFVIDTADEGLRPEIESLAMSSVVANSIMSDIESAARLAEAALVA